MKKNDLIEEIMKSTGASRYETELVLNNAFDIIGEKMTTGEKVYISGFGTFEVHQRASHKASNPRTGESIIVGAYKAPVFRASASLKEKINEK